MAYSVGRQQIGQSTLCVFLLISMASLASAESGSSCKHMAPPKLAISDCAKIINSKERQTTRDLVDAHTHLGTAYKARFEMFNAISSYEAAIKLNPETALAKMGLFLVRETLRKSWKAIERASVNIALNPKNSEAYRARGLARLQIGLFVEAVDDFTKAISMNSIDVLSLNDRGRALTFQGKYDKALADFDQAIKLDPVLLNSYINRSVTNRELGNDRKSRDDLEHVLAISPKNEEALKLLESLP